MIDIHSHILPFVDDGSASLETSLRMLEDLVESGVTDVILTPHHNKRFEKDKEQLLKEFEEFKKSAKDIPINLYLGQEIEATKETFSLLEKGELITLGNSKYILLEFDYFNYQDIVEFVYRAVVRGYIPIVAHVERYEYFTLEDAMEVKKEGGLIQVNASSLAIRQEKHFGKKVKALIKKGLVDFVASDYHDFRQLSILDAKKVVEKKFGKEIAQNLFIENARKIIEG